MSYDVVCLDLQDLCSPIDSLRALYANHPGIPIVCANLEVAGSHALSFAPYIVREVASDATKVKTESEFLRYFTKYAIVHRKTYADDWA